MDIEQKKLANNTEDTTDNTDDTFIKLHNLYFTATLISIVELVKQTSIDYCEKKGKTSKNNMVLQEMCSNILSHYKKDGSENNENNEKLSERQVLIKIYSTMRTYSDFLLNRSSELFDIKDQNNKIQTIIPGIDIGLIYKKLSEQDQLRLWKLFSLLFITCTRIVHSINGEKIKPKHKENVKTTNEKLEKYLEEQGINVKQMLFNPFLGLGEDNTNYGLNELFAGIINSPEEGNKTMNIESLIKMVGLNIDDLDKNIREKCKDITDDEINAVTGQITDFFGDGDGDSTINQVCGTMIKHVIKDVKDNGIKNMTQTAKNTFGKIEKDIGKKKLKKAMKKMKNKVENKYGKGGKTNPSGIINEIINNQIKGEGVGGIVQKLGEMMSGKK